MINICAALKFEIKTIGFTAGWHSSGHVINGKFSGNTTLDPMMLAKAMALPFNANELTDMAVIPHNI